MPSPQSSIPDILTAVQGFAADIQAAGVNPADHKQIVAWAQQALKYLDQLQPHISKANAAFGPNTALNQQVTDLRNRFNKVIAAYTGP